MTTVAMARYPGLQTPEDRNPEKAIRNERLAPFQDAFAEYLRKCAESREGGSDFYKLSKEFYKFVLTPQEIQEVLDSTIRLAPISMMRGFVLTQLIQQSYYAGHSNFNITTTQNIDYLGYELRCSPKKVLHFTLHGDAGHQTFQEAAYINVLVSGNAGDRIGRMSENCVIEIQGDAETYTAELAKNCTFKLRKSFQTIGPSTIDCIIQAYRRATYNKLLRTYLPDNTIQLRNRKNEIIAERK